MTFPGTLGRALAKENFKHLVFHFNHDGLGNNVCFVNNCDKKFANAEVIYAIKVTMKTPAAPGQPWVTTRVELATYIIAKNDIPRDTEIFYDYGLTPAMKKRDRILDLRPNNLCCYRCMRSEPKTPITTMCENCGVAKYRSDECMKQDSYRHQAYCHGLENKKTRRVECSLYTPRFFIRVDSTS